MLVWATCLKAVVLRLQPWSELFLFNGKLPEVQVYDELLSCFSERRGFFTGGLMLI
jgi:hypothetical protein